MPFTHPHKTLFKDCDPAGIVFFPRYFEMIADATEAFFEEALNTPYPDLLKTHGVPTAQIEATFTAPSRHGDTLKITITCENLGRTSTRLKITAHCADQLRFTAHTTLVLITKTGAPTPWPAPLRAALQSQIQGSP